MIALCAVLASAVLSSFYPVRLDDPKATYLGEGGFSVAGDGVRDDTDGIQSAIDHVQRTSGQGIVFVPSGTYRISLTLVVWPGVRVIGYGPTRPVLKLADNTPGYQDRERFMVFFAGRGPADDSLSPKLVAPEGKNGLDFEMPNEANPGTFYSALSNVDFEIGEGNPAAVGVRGRYAQHCYLSHINFRLGSALAAIHDTGNFAEDLRFEGGQYGIITRTPSPGWQFTLLDSTFEGQKIAAIRTHETGLTLIRPTFRRVPTAIAVEPGHTEQLWMSDARMENVSGPAIVFGREKSLRLQLNARNVVCSNVPQFASMTDTDKVLRGPSKLYEVRNFSHGQTYRDLNDDGKVHTAFETRKLSELPPTPPTDVAPLPPAGTWANLRSLGAKGDGVTDDTEALRRAIETHAAIYLPTGKYRVSDTIRLRKETVLIGLNPITTQIVLPDATPGFAGTVANGNRRPAPNFPGDPKPLLETPAGGSCIVTGIGLDTGGNNPSAVGALWRSGENSMMDDIKFLGGHGSGAGAIYNENHSADPDPSRRWDSQYPSLWVLGGGGTFKNIWTASPFAQAGMRISDTKTAGRVYEMSSEHHVRNEVQLWNVANWGLFALQTEEERGESGFALPLELQGCQDVTIANLNMYRVVSMAQPFPQAIKATDCRNVQLRGVHCYSNSKVSFDNLLTDPSTGAELRQREFASLVLDGRVEPRKPDRRVERIATGFDNISGGAVDPDGNFTFIDPKWHRIYRWIDAERRLELLSDAPFAPVNLAYDRQGNLLVVGYLGKGTVVSLRPGETTFRPLEAVPAAPRPAATPVLPVTDWQIAPETAQGRPLQKPWHFVSPDGTTFLPATQSFIEGTLTWGTKLQDVIRTFALSPATPGKPFYISGESECRTYAAEVHPDGFLTNGRLFAEQGGEGVAVDSIGNVYLAAGQIHVYSPSGKLMDIIRVPERPIQIAFSGDTLFIAARTSLYRFRRRR
jgi:hypothetical protein